MNKHLKIGIAIVVMMLAIGFASVTTNLILNNNVKLGFNSSNFDVYFSSAVPETNGTATIDSSTRQTITYETKTLKQVGDQAYLDYVVTNASTQYDANCTVEFTIDNGADEYVTIEQTGFIENVTSLVEAQNDKSGRIVITLKKGSMEPLQIHFTLKLIFEPVGREEEAQGEPTDTNKVLKVFVDNRPMKSRYIQHQNGYIYDLYIPGFDDTGNNLREYVTVDLYTQYKNSTMEIVEVDSEIFGDEVENSVNTVVPIGVTDNKYSFRIYLNDVSEVDFIDSNYIPFKVILRSKVDPSVIIFDKTTINLKVGYNNPFNSLDEYGNPYVYERGVKPWATWFMNDGRETLCYDNEDCGM